MDTCNITIGQILAERSLPRREIEILLAFSLKKTREYLLAHPEGAVKATGYRKYLSLAKKRQQGWPVAYLTGQQGFYGLELSVDEKVLIPRPETEMMVDEILARQKDIPAGATFVDVGTGSGAIIIALAINLRAECFSFLATDISSFALSLARKNSRRYKLGGKIRFSAGNLLAPIKKGLVGRDLVIAANLPYLTARQIASSPSIKKEPRLALYGGSNGGWELYEALFKQLGSIPYRSLRLFSEIDPGQAKAISVLARSYFPASRLVIKDDLAGNKRLAIIG